MAELRVIFWNMKIKLRVFLTHLTLRIDQQEIFIQNISYDIFLFLLLFNIFKAIWKLSKVVKETAIFIM